MGNIIVGTAILWGLTSLIVLPLTKMSVTRRLAEEGVNEASEERLSEDAKKQWQGIYNRYYMTWDVVVLGIAGLIGGLLGYYFIGLSLEARGWPGMLAFIGASFLGLSLK
jgi:hypothetical protein